MNQNPDLGEFWVAWLLPTVSLSILFDFNGPAFLTFSIASFEVRLAIIGSQDVFGCSFAGNCAGFCLHILAEKLWVPVY
ncbi:hypothetical protein ISN45_Aa07g026790 [Arabidopsis thaliana x Arabidopsis arenosa]|uniref:Transmembrane protein n=1 Tax=Arabidopsis thaliana x Arabidopsis arenosa TaxID=1240361 RepID=A0A8T1Y743_9BRAS|nr:hypothetical protein ISN45_Aa07g005220 [Arabidopsis thaliana x Arabidopsis arenosa]KAG7542720.1 hypothetical protein ISN45_Aa07g026790 [Arabidopsis thaliana x Arabidopsis arenosa]